MTIEFINISEQEFIAKYPYMYRYMSFENIMDMFQKNKIRMASPSTWKDPYEKYFYESSYQFPNNACKNIDNHNNLFACCFTYNGSCEASWKMYRPNSAVLQAKFHTQTLIDALRKTKGPTIYIGIVNYSNTKNIVKEAKQSISNFNGSSTGELSAKEWLNILLYKRSAFSYEKEIRLFTFADDNVTVDNKNCFLPLNNANNACSDITISPELSSVLADTIKHTLKSFGINAKHSYLYKGLNSKTIVI